MARGQIHGHGEVSHRCVDIGVGKQFDRTYGQGDLTGEHWIRIDGVAEVRSGHAQSRHPQHRSEIDRGRCAQLGSGHRKTGFAEP